MRWVFGILLALVLLVFTGVGAFWYLYFYEPPPDERLACYYGAYDLSDGRVVVLNPSSGPQSLRFVFMDGDTGRLLPVAGQSGIPKRFTAGPGYSGETPVRAVADFGGCTEETISLALDGKPALIGKRRTFDITDVTFFSHGTKLNGRLVMPRLEGVIPVAVLVHGSERDSAVLFNRLQYLLPANGIGVFVYDKRGTGKSDGSYTQDFDLLADDAAAALTKARALAGPLASEIGFQGGSQAGWIEPLAAMKVKADFVLVGFGLAESPHAEDREVVFDDLRAADYGDDVLAKSREVTDATAIVVGSHFTRGFDALDAVKAKYGNEPWLKKIKGQYSGLLLGYPTWLAWILGPWLDAKTPLDYDPLPPLQAYQGPQLWVLAGRDALAPSRNTLRILRELQPSHPNLSVVLFPTADHGITEFTEKNGERIDTRFSPGYFPLIVDWLLFKDIRITAPGPIVYRNGAVQAPAPEHAP